MHGPYFPLSGTPNTAPFINQVTIAQRNNSEALISIADT